MENQRTTLQNSALHAWCRELAKELNDRGLYMQVVLKPSYDIEWDEHTVKEHIVRPIAEKIAQTDKTSRLTTKQFSKVVDVIDKNLLAKWQIDMPFSEDYQS